MVGREKARALLRARRVRRRRRKLWVGGLRGGEGIGDRGEEGGLEREGGGGEGQRGTESVRV